MVKLLRRRIVLAAAAALLALCPVERPAAATQAGNTERIVVVGDIHGAADGLKAILRAAGLIETGGRWSGGTARLVQTGDFLDRGAKVREVMDLLMRLEGEARRAGGRVDVLFGNHEAFAVLRELRDVSPDAYATFADGRSDTRRNKAYDAHAEIVKPADLPRKEWMAAHPPGQVEYLEATSRSGRYGRWIRSRQAILQIGDTIFMHAGLHPDSTASIEDVNRAVEREVDAWDSLVEALGRERLVGPAFGLQEIVDAAQLEIGRIVEAQRAGKPLADHVTPEFVAHLKRFPEIVRGPLVAPEGPLWYRGLATLPAGAQPQVDALLRRLGAERIVIGHTPQLPGGRITARFGGRVILIDTGMLASHFKGGQPSALEIHNGRMTAIYAGGREPVASSSERRHDVPLFTTAGPGSSATRAPRGDEPGIVRRAMRR
ncbi:MAG: metallophosphoesterase [Vicinamibacterales bacterium]